MSYIDNELKRVIKYAEGLGIKITFKKHYRGNPNGAEWSTDGSEIIIYTWASQSKTRVILDFIHELAHHMAYIYNNRKGDLKTDQLLDKELSTLTKAQRKRIYDFEKNDAQYQEIIFNELGLKIPKYKLYVSIDLSNWTYYKFYQTGKFPSQVEMRNKELELIKKYRK